MMVFIIALDRPCGAVPDCVFVPASTVDARNVGKNIANRVWIRRMTCGNCDIMYCEDCVESSSERGDQRALVRCDVCETDSCKACDNETVRICEGCSKTLCDKRVDMSSEAFEGRFCSSCTQDGADDMRRENEMICLYSYGSDYEEYM
jgi:hypothetical protein